jgi:hypothetical protein
MMPISYLICQLASIDATSSCAYCDPFSTSPGFEALFAGSFDIERACSERLVFFAFGSVHQTIKIAKPNARNTSKITQAISSPHTWQV